MFPKDYAFWKFTANKSSECHELIEDLARSLGNPAVMPQEDSNSTISTSAIDAVPQSEHSPAAKRKTNNHRIGESIMKTEREAHLQQIFGLSSDESLIQSPHPTSPHLTHIALFAHISFSLALSLKPILPD